MIEKFDNRESDYLAWLRSHSAGYVLSTFREKSDRYTSIHRSTCMSIRTRSTRMRSRPFTGRRYIKICSENPQDLKSWARQQGCKRITTICKICKPAVIPSLRADFATFQEELAAAVDVALKGDPAKRTARLKKASRMPKKRLISITVYERNPDVIAQVLLKAEGTCGGCGAKAPFFRAKDGSPYLEVHHRKQLSEGGEDTVRNAIALCPNCHRERHHG